jgi:glutamine synthetase
MDRKEIIDRVKSSGIAVLRLFFTDVVGRLKGLNISVSELERALDEGVNFDGSSIEGFARIEESDLLAMPDLDSFRLFPFESGGVKSAMFICDVLQADGRPLASDPRRVLRLTIEKAAAAGFARFLVGPELEYFYFPSDHEAVPLDASGYFDILPLDRCADARKAALSTLRAMGMIMEASHHEVAPSQHELDFRYGDAVTMADQIMIAKLVIKQVARANGVYATFMPKPIATENGSGMHVHQSLFNGRKNAFYSATDPYNLSAVARKYIAGLLVHSREITAVTNQCVNSYKRLVPGYEAPVNICWGRKNRSALVRVPSFRAGKSESCRVEYRAPDAAANPYLAFAVMLAAGLEGIRKGYALPEPVEHDTYHMTQAQRDGLQIASLPGDLNTATSEAARSQLLKDTLGEELTGKFLANKFEEWDRYRIHVTDYELKTYLPVL